MVAVPTAAVPTSATFTFTGGFAGKIVGVSVETPTAELTDMSAAGDPKDSIFMVPTGAWSGGSITVEFISTGTDPQTSVKKVGSLTFASAAFSVTRQVVCESASVSAKVGDVVRGSAKFCMTDWHGT